MTALHCGAFRLFTVLAIASSIGQSARASWFIRGDADGSGRRNIADVVRILGSLFRTDEVALRCLDAADVDDDDRIEITDAIDLLQYLFLAGPRTWPRPLFPGCWFDEGETVLGCEESGACSPQGVFFACDKSGSMNDKVLLDLMKGVLTRGISQLSEKDRFAVLFFDASLTRYPPSTEPASATTEAKAAALDFVESVVPGHGTCPKPALRLALDFADRSAVPSKRIIFITDGYPFCSGSVETYKTDTLTELAERNTGGVVIDTVGIGFPGSVDEDWLQEIAGQNGGTYAHLGP